MGLDAFDGLGNLYGRCFNSRARMGRDKGHRGLATDGRVSTHAPAWGAIQDKLIEVLSLAFQLTRPHGARSNSSRAITSGREFQLTRPHGARFTLYPYMVDGWRVSTHAPAWGAMTNPRTLLSPYQFQLTRPHGARFLQTLLASPAQGFNSRARMGRDRTD